MKKVLAFFQPTPRPPHVPSAASTPKVIPSIPTIPDNPSFPTAQNPPNPMDDTSPLITVKKLAAAIKNLPETISKATNNDLLAEFCTLPTKADTGHELWEVVINPSLHRVFQGKTAEQLAPHIRRGHCGIEGFLCYITHCVLECQVDEILFEPRVELLIEAMQTM